MSNSKLKEEVSVSARDRLLIYLNQMSNLIEIVVAFCVAFLVTRQRSVVRAPQTGSLILPFWQLKNEVFAFSLQNAVDATSNDGIELVCGLLRLIFDVTMVLP